jgi:hypothetical protein
MSHSGRIFLSEIVPKFLFPYAGVVFRLDAYNIIFMDSVANTILLQVPHLTALFVFEFLSS